jgi:peptidoglycan hydrolase-like protein with peptidoglycan-binding domain
MAGARIGGRSRGYRGQHSFGRMGAPWRFSWDYSGDGPETTDAQLIAWIQSCLAQSVGSWVPQTGSLGPATRRAIRMFQSHQSLPANGVPDSDTVAALQKVCGSGPLSARNPGAASPASSAGFQQSTAGEIATPSPAGCNEDRCASSYIAWMQRSLNQLGGKLSVTGVLDRQTINALTQFKQGHGVSWREYYASPKIEQALLQAGATPPPPVRRLVCGPTGLSQLLPLLRRYGADIPAEYLLGWITVESGGKLGDLTKICERGYFQVHPEESQDLKLDHDRLSTDPAYSVEGGIKLVRKYAAGVKSLAGQFNLNKDTDLFWGLVKLRHWIPSAPLRILSQMRRDSVAVTDWNSVRQYVRSKPALGFGSFDPRSGVNSVDNYLAAVARWRKFLGSKT